MKSNNRLCSDFRVSFDWHRAVWRLL